jgi:hypothetical protein
MKTKAVVLMFTLVFALAMIAQSTTQSTPAPAGDNTKTCACCNHDKTDAKADEKMACCGKDGGCCKDGKCDMAAHKDGKMACCSGDKCPMKTTSKDGKMADGKSCCAGGKCPMMAKDKKATNGRCCCNMEEPQHPGM